MLIQTELRFERRGNVGLQGANSTVFFAFDHQLNAEIVVKQVPKVGIVNPAEYFAEASLLYATRHPNVVDVKYSCEDTDHIYLAMPKYAGSLHGVLEQRALTVREIVKIGLDLLTGLHHVHAKSLIHFDVKPSNVLLDDGGRAALADFGFSRQMDGHGLATPSLIYNRHIPPESIATSSALSSASDIYQAGLTLYRMCVGLAFFQAQFNQLVAAWGPNWRQGILQGQFPNRQHFPAHIPARLRSLIIRAIAVDPAARYQSALAMANELARVDEHLDWQFAVPVAGVGAWELDDGSYVRRVTDEPDGSLRRVSATRTNKSTGKTSTLHALGGTGLSPAKATAKIQDALAQLDGTAP